MKNDSSLGDLQHATMACGDDGIWDIALGTILLLFGVILFLAWQTAWAALVVLVPLLALIAKRKITAPRLREYEKHALPTSSIGAAVWILVLMTLVVAALLSLLLWFGQDGLLPEWAIGLLPIVLPVMLALMAVVIMVTAGTMVGASARYFIYAAAMAVGFLALLWETTPDWITLAIPGLLMIMVGLGCVARFLVSHPMVPREQRVTYEF